MVPILLTNLLMSATERGVPIMTDFRQARDANMARILEGLHNVFGASYKLGMITSNCVLYTSPITV